MVSIVIPVYNVDRYIRQCLDSIVKQAYVEQIIIVDDGSTDKSCKIINEYAQKYNKIMFLEQKNAGVSSARNFAIKYIKGKYTLFIDPDDYLEDDCISIMYSKAVSTDADIVICGYKMVFDDTIKGKDKYILHNKSSEKFYTGYDVETMMLNVEVQGYLWNKLFKTENIFKHNLKFDEGRYIQDWYPVFCQVHNSSRIVFVNKSLYNYRQRGNSTVNKKNEKILNDYEYAVSKILRETNRNFSDKEVEVFKAKTFSWIIRMYCKVYGNNYHDIYDMFKSSKFNKYDVNIFSLINNIKYIGIKDILVLILWKVNLYNYFYKIWKKLIYYRNSFIY